MFKIANKGVFLLKIFVIVLALFLAYNTTTFVVNKIETFFGIPTKEELKVKIDEQKQALKQIENINKQNIKNQTDLIMSYDISKTEIVKQYDNNTKIDKINTAKAIKVKERIEVINNEYKDKLNTSENIAEKEKLISTEQINSLWEVYCDDSNSSVEQCKAGV